VRAHTHARARARTHTHTHTPDRTALDEWKPGVAQAVNQSTNQSTNYKSGYYILADNQISSCGSRRGFAAARLLALQVPNPPGSRMSFVIVVCPHIEVLVRGRSLVQRSPTECGVSECDHEVWCV